MTSRRSSFEVCASAMFSIVQYQLTDLQTTPHVDVASPCGQAFPTQATRPLPEFERASGTRLNLQLQVPVRALSA